jgi:mannose-1-phosphate guanylyltransferase
MNSHSTRAPARCGIVLAAGEGKRLRPLVHRLRGDTLPKQYVNFVGRRSLLEHTFSRAERLFDPRRIFTVVSQDHLRYPDVRRQLSARESHTVIVQPENKETAPGLLLPLAHLYKRHGDAVVAVFPSDHFIVEEELFMAHVALACRVVERHPRYLVLLGMEPWEPETDYGYIRPGNALKELASLGVRPVVQFREKPNVDCARELIRAGGFWNTMVMVSKAKTLIDLVRDVSPRLRGFLKRVQKAIGTSREREAIVEAYRLIEPVNFSTGLLEVVARTDASRLLVLPVRGVFWSDLGSERRLMRALNRFQWVGDPATSAHSNQWEDFPSAQEGANNERGCQ